MLKSSSSVRSIYHTSINQFGYLCGASYPSSQHLLPLISFEALQSSAVFCHSRHTSNFLIDVGYLQYNISISTTNYPHHIPISKYLFNHAMIYQRQKVIGIVPAAITPNFYFIFSTPTMSGSQKGSWIQTKVNMYVIISEQIAPAHSWSRSFWNSTCITVSANLIIFCFPA